MKKQILTIVTIVLFISSCKDKTAETPEVETVIKVDKTITIVDSVKTPKEDIWVEKDYLYKGDVPATSLDWMGTYKGTSPCADCEERRISITLNEDFTYVVDEEYYPKDKFHTTGKFQFDVNGGKIKLIDEKNKGKYDDVFIVGEGYLLRVFEDGTNANSGDKTDVFKKVKG